MVNSSLEEQRSYTQTCELCDTKKLKKDSKLAVRPLSFLSGKKRTRDCNVCLSQGRNIHKEVGVCFLIFSWKLKKPKPDCSFYNCRRAYTLAIADCLLLLQCDTTDVLLSEL